MKKLNVPQEKLDQYAEFLKEDYNNWTKGDPNFGGFGVEFQIGSKYIRVITTDGKGGSRSAHSFIVNKSTKKFPVGTILKAASWKAPAVNFARGDLMTWSFVQSRIRWTGIV